ncbi:MAG: class I SAM-dependent methyltransferase [Clostridiales bacterium]|nr:class I SAM-dependent methyltransferase [Clostridiales bacterium]
MSSIGFYQIIAKAYDLLDVTYFRDYDRSPRKAVLERIGDNDDVLDLCCGTATNAINISKAKHSIEVTGIDLSDKMLGIGKAKVNKEHLFNVTLKQMNAMALEFPDGTFNKVLISLVLHELDKPLVLRKSEK